MDKGQVNYPFQVRQLRREPLLTKFKKYGKETTNKVHVKEMG